MFFFNEPLKRKLADTLRPWLCAEPFIVFKLGLFRSYGSVKKLRFDASALNRIIASPSRISIEKITVEEISISLSLWSGPAFTFEVHGLCVVVAAGEGSSNAVPEIIDSSEEDLRKTLFGIDPEGSAFHDVLEQISAITLRNGTRTTFWNIILRHCRLQMYGIDLQLQVPLLDDCVICLAEARELNVESQYPEHGCILRELFCSTLFTSSRKSSFVLNCRGFKYGLKMKDHINYIISSTDMSTCFILNDLQLAYCKLSVLESSLSVSPSDIAILLAVVKLLSKASNRTRNGRQLWKLARNGICDLNSTRRLSVYKVGFAVILWLRYVTVYKNLVLQVGFSAETLSVSLAKMSSDKKFASSVKHQLKMVAAIEKKLPAEAVSRARRIGRYRASLNDKLPKDSYDRSLGYSLFKFFNAILQLVASMWKVLCYMLNPLAHFLYLRKHWAGNPRSGKLGTSEESFTRFCFCLNIGDITITGLPTNATQSPLKEVLNSYTEMPHLDLLSFCISINALFLRYSDNVYEHSFSVSSGDLKVMACPVDHFKESSLKSFRSLKGNLKSLTILWSEPLKLFAHSEIPGTIKRMENAYISFLESIFRETLLRWKRSSVIFEANESHERKFEQNDVQYSKVPCLLFEIKDSITNSLLKNQSYGSLKCGFSVGKLNLVLGELPILSITLFLTHLQYATFWIQNRGTPGIQPHSPQSSDNPHNNNWNSMYNKYIRKVKVSMPSVLPEKHIELAVNIAGLHVQMSSRNEAHSGRSEDTDNINTQDNIQFAIDVNNIEATVWPSSSSEFVPLSRYLGWDSTKPESHTMKEPQKIEIPMSDNKHYMSRGRILLASYLRVHGVTACLQDAKRKQQFQILEVRPVTFKLSYFREYLHSFSSMFAACSADLHGMHMGFTMLLCMDELSFCTKVIAGLHSALSYGSDMSDSIGLIECQAPIHQDIEPASQSIAKESYSFMTTLFIINCTFDLKSMDLILQSSRKNIEMDVCMKPFIMLAEHDLPDNGIQITIQQLRIDISCDEAKSEVLTNLSGVRSSIFTFPSQIRKNTGVSELKDLLLQSLDCSCEMFFSNCTLIIWLGSIKSDSSPGCVTYGFDASTSGTKDIHPSSVVIERSSVSASQFDQKFAIKTSNLHPVTNHWVLINMTVSEIFITRCSVKNMLLGAHKTSNLRSSLSVGGEFQRFSWEIQGATIFLETSALSMLIHDFASYLRCATVLLSVRPSDDKSGENFEPGFHTIRPNDSSMEECAQGEFGPPPQEIPDHLKAFTMDLSQFYLVLLIEDEHEEVGELVLEADLFLSLEVANMKRTTFLNLSRLSILSQLLQKGLEIEVQTPHFSSLTSGYMPFDLVSGESALYFHNANEILPSIEEASCSTDSVERNESSGLSNQSYILKHFKTVISVQNQLPGVETGSNLNSAWFGSGSVSGFDMTISLNEVEMILSMGTSFSGTSKKDTPREVKQRQGYNDQESDLNLKREVPDGAIVAIQDVHQHIYFAVEGAENRYHLAGVMHYSLAGERALFRVKYQKQRTWTLPSLWFSLISLHAKSDSGEPLRLNYCKGSGFVGISSNNDSADSLWTALSYEPETFENGLDSEHCNHLAKNNFYLVNKKNDCGVACVDGVPEFLRKPGNLFKFKVFNNLSPARDGAMVKASKTNCEDEPGLPKETIPPTGPIPSIDVRVEKMTLTIVHELTDKKDKVPLFQACLDTTQLIVQMLSSKARVISTLMVVLSYFDAQRNLWREFVPPAEICIFYRSTFQTQGPLLNGVPVHFYVRFKKLNINLTELSLDIILFMIGELDLAGPFSVKSSMILANCCKLENKTGLNLLCHFLKDQDVTIAREQSASIHLRRLALADQSSGNESTVSFQLALLGAFLTSPIQVSFLESRALAWRTRIVSVQDSRSYPGPFIVVDISRKTEDGLTITVSPLIKIYNETEFTLELQFQQPLHSQGDSASILLKPGETIDDSMTVFDALNSAGGSKKALTSLSMGNFLFSFRPRVTGSSGSTEKYLSIEWSDELKGGKAVRLAGILETLTYRVKKAFSVGSSKSSVSTACCQVESGDSSSTSMHFLIQSIGRNVPVIQPDKFGDAPDNRTVALQEQKEIYLLPTVQVSNFLQFEIHVLLTETDLCSNKGHDNIGNQATIPCGSTVNLYANPTIIYFTVTITALNSSSKPVNSSDWVKRLHKQKNEVHSLDIDLVFSGGKYQASLRLFRGKRGILEAAIYTSYTLKNDTDFLLLFYPPYLKPLSREEAEKFGFVISPELGLALPPKSTGSWLLKSNKVHLKMLQEKATEEVLHLDALSGFTELSLEREDVSGCKYITKLGLSLGPSLNKVVIPSQTITMVPRHLVANESRENVIVRQCYLQDDAEGSIISCGQKTTLQLRETISKRRQVSVFDNFIRKHRSTDDGMLTYVQFRMHESDLGWSGPICIDSLGRFFIKFRKYLDLSLKQEKQTRGEEKTLTEFAAVHVIQDGSILVLHFHKPPDTPLPYRIENSSQASITYYQKDSSDPEILGSESSVDYVWDDMTLPHKLVVQISDMHLVREINLDKVRPWKSLFKTRQRRGLTFPLPLDKKPKDKRKTNNRNTEMVNVGYEVYADGPTRVLRICEFSGSHSGATVLRSSSKFRLRLTNLSVHFLEHGKQDQEANGSSVYTPIIVARLGNISLDSLVTDEQKYYEIGVQSLNVDEKWAGASLGAMLRRHASDSGDTSDCTFRVIFVLSSSRSNVKQVKYSSVLLRPVDLNLDEETLMRLVPFWRTSLSTSTSPSQQYYFDHFEIHPVKIIASFLPGDSFSSYSSSQETLRSLLHSVMKIPAIKNMAVELNGVLVTHALVTIRELMIKCAQHYSWYAMRSIYIAKGSTLLPPAFASLFDDMASSSLDVFFDPSSGVTSLPGLTLGTFKLISKCIDAKGFSGSKRYFGDLGKTLRTAGSNVLFAAVTEISDSVLKGAEASGFNGMIIGFHQGILKLAMEPSLLGTLFMEGGPDRKIKLDRSSGVDELYIEGYLQAMLDTMYKQEYLRVRVVDDQVFLKNLPPNSSLIDEIMDRVKRFLVSKALLKGDSSTSRPLRHLRGDTDWKIGPTVLTLCEHLFVCFAIRILRKQTGKAINRVKLRVRPDEGDHEAIVSAQTSNGGSGGHIIWKWGISKFILSAMVAYIDGRLCRRIPNPIARRVVSGFMLSFLDTKEKE